MKKIGIIVLAFLLVAGATLGFYLLYKTNQNHNGVIEPVSSESIEVVNLHILGGNDTLNPFSTVQSIEKITWDARMGNQSGFQLNIANTINNLTKNPDYSCTKKTTDSYFNIKANDTLAGLLKKYPGRWYYTVRLTENAETNQWGNWSFETAANKSYQLYNTSCNQLFGYNLAENWVYHDWFYVNSTFTGYVWDATLANWGFQEQAIHPWGAGHHHMWGETSGSREFIRDNDGNLYVSVYNIKASQDDRVGCLLISQDNGTTWEILDINSFIDDSQAYMPFCLAYDSTNNYIHLILRKAITSLDAALYHMSYSIDEETFSSLSLITREHIDGYARQTPSAAVDEQGNLYVAWYACDGMFGGEEPPYICYAKRNNGTNPSWEQHATMTNCVAANGVIPSIYAAPHHLHLFFFNLTDSAHNHYILNLDSTEKKWVKHLSPFGKEQGMLGAFDHDVAVEIQNDSNYSLHFVSPGYDPLGDRQGYYRLYYNVYEHNFSQEANGWKYGYNESDYIFDMEEFKNVTGMNQSIDLRIFEYPSISFDSNGDLAVVFRIKQNAQTPENSEFYHNTSCWFTEKNALAWITKEKGKSWSFSEHNIIGGFQSDDIGSYRALFAKPAGQTTGYIPMVWAIAEHYQVWPMETFEIDNTSYGYSDFSNPYGFNVYKLLPLSQNQIISTDQQILYRYYPFFHALTYTTISLNH